MTLMKGNTPNPKFPNDEKSSAYARMTTGRSNGGRSLKAESKQRYREAIAFTRLLRLLGIVR